MITNAAAAGRDPLIDVALELERVARSDEYFVKRKLYPNVDFFSGGCLFLAVWNWTYCRVGRLAVCGRAEAL